jgi:hypothetical protein
MPFFRRAKREPVVHPRVARIVYVRASLDAATKQLTEYSMLTGRGGEAMEVAVATSGGWVALRLPETIHPWQPHNVAWWMLDTPGATRDGLVADSAAAPTFPAYRFAPDLKLDDTLSGRDSLGRCWTLHVPSNSLAGPEEAPIRDVLVHADFGDWRIVKVRFEDPGHEQNPSMEATFPSRQAMMLSRRITGDFVDR